MEIDKKKLSIFIGLAIFYLVIFAIIIFVIWSPSDKNKYLLKYKQYTEQEAFEISKNKYCSEIALALSLNQYTKIYNSLTEDFISSEKITKANINSYLENNGYYSSKVSAGEYEAYNSAGNTVFVVDFKIGNNTKKITIIESIPGNYKITLGNKLYGSATFSDNTKETVSEGIKFNITKLSSDTNGVKYKIEITNQNDSNVEFDFSSVLNIYLETSESTFVYLNDTISEATDGILSKNSRITKTLYFLAGAETQTKAKSIVFTNVKIGNENKTVKVSL